MTLSDREVAEVRNILDNEPPDWWGQAYREELEQHFTRRGMDVAEASQLALKCMRLGVGDDGQEEA